MIVEHRSRAGVHFVRLSLGTIYPEGDIISSGRDCAIDLQYQPRGDRPFDSVPFFRVIRGDSGMAFPELLRAYSKLFAWAADFTEGKEPIDYQI